MNNIFNYQLSDETIVFTDTLKKGSPYIAKTPRNHESIFFVTNGTLLYENGDMKEVIEDILSMDPRPSYHNDPERVYGMFYEDYNIKFSVCEKLLTIVEIIKNPMDK